MYIYNFCIIFFLIIIFFVISLVCGVFTLMAINRMSHAHYNLASQDWRTRVLP